MLAIVKLRIYLASPCDVRNRVANRRWVWGLLIDDEPLLAEVVRYLNLSDDHERQEDVVGLWWISNLAERAIDLILTVADELEEFEGMGIPFPGPSDDAMEEAMYLVGKTYNSPISF